MTDIDDIEAAIDNLERACFQQGRDEQRGDKRRDLRSGVDRAREKVRLLIAMALATETPPAINMEP